MSEVSIYRDFLKSNIGLTDNISDRKKKIPHPQLQKNIDKSDIIINLPSVSELLIKDRDIYNCIKKRRSRRMFSAESLSVEELTYLLWATQGVEKVLPDNSRIYRTVPSAGGRHPFETYLIINNVDGIEKGIYRFLSLTNQLIFLFYDEDYVEKLNKYTFGQKFIGQGSVVFVWSCIPYRSEWEYNISAHKAILLDAGHMCQNLYLACESIGLGTCAIASYMQKEMDKFLKLDGDEEFVIYLAPVGKCKK
ncbi:SagB/ThcOx family dehydrogenase [Clostridium sp. P21]|uniref:SagB/ThcOx family dehydrogenase n=1 Tax=Clostridium muellerianum TaxID=2716538 RepID=A0A7Y0HPP3_9CLOT|nr:SagB/ThcOx family dehydrogenase [Clostridium muellerianum]NMM62913.1 SagB/ThcOx family dehydrogenase [Clostridium muellerianum]